MKKQLLILAIAALFTNALIAQSISFTSSLTEAEIGSTVTINYTYTIPGDGNIYCAINLYDDWTWQAMVADGVLSPAPAGTDVTGSFEFLIPEGTTETVDLTGSLNYKLVIELSNSNWQWLAGDYPATQINLTNTLSNDEFLKNDAISIFPNPASNKIEIGGLENLKPTNLIIYNSLGQQVQQVSNLEHNIIDVSRLNSGLYFVTLLAENKTQTFKFSKQ